MMLLKNSTMQFDYMLNWQHFLAGNSWAKDWTNNGPGLFHHAAKRDRYQSI